MAYWASEKKEDIGGELSIKINAFYQYVRTNNLWAVWRKAYRQYFRGFFTGAGVLDHGEQGEARKVYVNQFRNLLQHLKVLVTSARPAFICKAVNTDAKSSVQAKLGRGLLEYYMKDGQAEDRIDTVMDMALTMGEGWMSAIWDETEGTPYASYEDSGKEKNVKTGDVVMDVHNPFNVIRDIGERSPQNAQWYIVAKYVNKYDFAAKYPKYKEDIESMTYDNSFIDDYSDFFWDSQNRFNEEYTDQIPVYYFWHKKTTSLPEGRQTIMLSDETVLSDGALPYDDIPLISIMPSVQNDTAFGYTHGWDVLSLQEIHDMCASIITTNINTFGLQNVAVPSGSGLDAGDITGGLRLLKYAGEVAPQVLNLLEVPKTTMEMMVMTERMMETLSGVNSVSRGNPEGDMSGAAMALVQSMAIQFNSGLQHSYALFLERFGTHIIEMLKKYASVPRIAAISGEDNAPDLQEFTGDDIADIKRVFAEPANPMLNTLQGKTAIASDLLEKGIIRNPDQYLQVLQTGNLDNLTDGKTDQLNLIKKENEMLSAGGKPVPIATDDQFLHIIEHGNPIANVQVRQHSPEIVTNTLYHIQEHINMLKTVDPDLLQLYNQKPLGQAPAPQGAPPPPNPAQTGAMTNQMAAGMQPNMPSPPVNPLSGQQFDTQTGGLPPAGAPM